jgi:hypothetical protein
VTVTAAHAPGREPLSDTLRRDAVRLIRACRWAALATLQAGGPFASMVAYAPAPDMSRLLLHLSRLAPHTRNLMADPRASLVIGAADDGRDDPQTLARVGLTGSVAVIDKTALEYDNGRCVYLERLPESRRLFQFEDFVLLGFIPEEVRYVGGFGVAGTFAAAELTAGE